MPDTASLADLTEDAAHRTVTDTEKSTWNNKGTYSKPANGIPASDIASGVIPTKTSDLQNDSGFGTYSKPSGGIPKTDLANGVQTSLGKADSALQSVPNTYRTSAEQDVIDAEKQPKIDSSHKLDYSLLSGTPTLGTLAGKNSASGSITPQGTVSTPTITVSVSVANEEMTISASASQPTFIGTAASVTVS